MSEVADLSRIRVQIEALDEELIQLLKKRMVLSEAVAQAKLAAAIPFRDDERGERVLARVGKIAATHGLNSYEVERLFRFIMEMSISHQQAHVRALESKPMRVAFTRGEGDASPDLALAGYSGRPGGVVVMEKGSAGASVAALRELEVDFALVPLETALAGGVNETYALLAETGLCITSERLTHEARYVELALEEAAVPSGTVCKTSLILELEHRPGALGEVIQSFATQGVNLTKIESRPIAGKSGRYRFYVDVEGHAASGPLSKALELLRTRVAALRILGSYPPAPPIAPGGVA